MKRNKISSILFFINAAIFAALLWYSANEISSYPMGNGLGILYPIAVFLSFGESSLFALLAVIFAGLGIYFFTGEHKDIYKYILIIPFYLASPSLAILIPLFIFDAFLMVFQPTADNLKFLPTLSLLAIISTIIIMWIVLLSKYVKSGKASKVIKAFFFVVETVAFLFLAAMSASAQFFVCTSLIYLTFLWVTYCVFYPEHK